ncbi:alpha-glucosidase [Robiginitalea sp. SC105]|uniref:glycoside hydrolase family 13 protein n=1 Tax=Robiginitalea sp. SC105 TaxID=2762332 RepID=UPI00163AE8EE|nr:alpha-glucosidase [Robiginitalea sp. SC105]MBC2839173.1 alpha-glucosidase [Robiginitalea sp. SC105]
MKNYLIVLFALLLGVSCGETPEKAPPAIAGKTWWKEAVIYQLYPRSFKDSDGDGVGDLNGIIQELDYLQSLGITAIWLNPIYSSPNADNGYDVSDYRGIMEEFGTMSDFDRMLQGMHERGIRLIMDIVVNHSSEEHPWFLSARSSRDSPYRDYYHWWPAEKGVPPYRYSLFDATGNAWKFDSVTNAYYLHYFSAQQPDLKWENPEVRQEVYDIMTFWAEKGVDGFRLDAFQFAAKDTTYPEFPEGFEKDFIQYYAMQDGLHGYLKEMNREVLSRYDVMSVSEGAGRNFEDAHMLVDADREELDMAYAFEGVDIPKYEGYDLDTMKEVFGRWDAEFATQGWLSIFLANHDQARMVSRWGDDRPEFRDASASLLNTFILSMRGTPYCYYGDELGMTNMDMDSISEYNDIAAINGYEKARSEGADMAAFMERLNFTSRDNGRTPMQWTDGPHAGFTTGEPWLPVNENKDRINVARQDTLPGSVLNHFRKLTRLRRESDVLIYGAYELVDAGNPDIYAYTRSLGDEQVLVLLNFSSEAAGYSLPGSLVPGNRLIDNYDPDAMAPLDAGTLRPWQAVICKLGR